MSDADFHELFPLGDDDTPYRKLTGDYVAPASFDGRARGQGRARGADAAGARGLCRLPASAAPRPSGAAARHSRRPRGVGERPLCRVRPAEEREYRGRQGPADVPGHRHRDRDGQEGPECMDRRRRRGGAVRGHQADLYRAPFALQPGGALVDVRGGQYRRQSAGPDRPLRRARRPVQIPVHREGRRLGQQELSVPADQGGAEPEIADEIHRREAPHARHRRLSAVSSRDRDRRHLGRDESEDRETGELPLSRQPADLRQQIRPSLPRPRFRGRGAGADPRSRHRRAIRRQVFLP